MVAEKRCPSLSAPIDGYVTYSNEKSVGSEAHYYCYDGYTLIGSYHKIQCLENYSWKDHDIPYCRKNQSYNLYH